MDDTPRAPNYLLPILLIVALLVLLYGFNNLVQQERNSKPKFAAPTQPMVGYLTDATFVVNDALTYQPVFFAEPNLGLLPNEYPLQVDRSKDIAFLREQHAPVSVEQANYLLAVRNQPLQLELSDELTIATYLANDERKMTRQLVREILPELKIYIAGVQRAYDRPNPTQAVSELIQPELQNNSPTHPSSASASLHLLQLALSELNPSSPENIVTVVEDFNRTAEQAGLQFPSDTQAGIDIANAYFEAIRLTPEYQLLLTAAMTEQ